MAAREILARQDGDVFRPLAERGNEQAPVANQSVVQIVAKRTGTGEGGEVLVRGGDHRNVHGDAATATDAPKALALDDPQDLRLMLSPHRGDLVEEDGAAVTTLEDARLVEGPRERPARRAEELALEVILRNGRAIEDLVGAAGAGATLGAAPR